MRYNVYYTTNEGGYSSACVNAASRENAEQRVLDECFDVCEIYQIESVL